MSLRVETITSDDQTVIRYTSTPSDAGVPDDLYIEEVPTQGSGYLRCVICGGTDWDARDSSGKVAHEPACTQEFRVAVARIVGYA